MKNNNKVPFVPALGYSFLNSYYDLTIKLTMPEKIFRTKLIEYINPIETDNILEFGCGTGQNLIYLNSKEPKALVYGVDIDSNILKIADLKLLKLNISIPLLLYDGVKLPFSDKSFDKVFSSLVFHQIDAETKMHCLNELYRVLKPNGKLVIGDWGMPKSKWMRFSFFAVQLLDGFKTTKDNINGLMPQFISDAGFQNVSEVDFINTNIGTYSYYSAVKSSKQ
ncbi:MAG: class I SAM-dependent methyltransferase [Saprospiraceae bacterium]|nr:class I SAM-dependent methyltransferase [Candidatus Vicinibacter proximus]MBL7823518.1 class I SAM-dependent methyltransferase [Saprospiraceae bacterium]MCC6842728.1 class I SAM-dependent methyltransferase [Saprospiraceae bacterium]